MKFEIYAYIEPFEIQVNDHSQNLPIEAEVVQQSKALLSKALEIAASFDSETEFLKKAEELGLFSRLEQCVMELAAEDYELNSGSCLIEEPSVFEVAQSYHDAFSYIGSKEKMPRTCNVYEEVFSIEEESHDVSDFLRRMAERNLFVRLVAMPVVDKHENRDDGVEATLSSTIGHYKERCDLARSAKSTLEIEQDSLRLTEIYMMESMAESLLIRDLFGGLYSAICDYRSSHSITSAHHVARQFGFVESFFNVDFDSYFEIPKIREFIEKVILIDLRKTNDCLTLEMFVDELKMDLVSCLRQTSKPKDMPSSDSQISIWDQNFKLTEIPENIGDMIRPIEYR